MQAENAAWTLMSYSDTTVGCKTSNAALKIRGYTTVEQANGRCDDFKGLCTVHRCPVGAVRLCLKDLAGIDPSGLSTSAGSFLRGRTIFHVNRNPCLQNPFGRFFSNLVIMLDYVCVNMSANMVRYYKVSLLQSWFEV